MALPAAHVEEDHIARGGGLFRVRGTFAHGKGFAGEHVAGHRQQADAEHGFGHARQELAAVEFVFQCVHGMGKGRGVIG